MKSNKEIAKGIIELVEDLNHKGEDWQTLLLEYVTVRVAGAELNGYRKAILNEKIEVE